MKITPALILALLVQTVFAQQSYIKHFQDANGKYGYKNEKDEIVAAPKYDYAQVYIKDGLALVNIGGTKVSFGYEGGSWAYIDITGKEVIRLGSEFYKATSFEKGRAMVGIKDKETKKFLFIDKSGKIITQNGKQNYNNGNYSGDLSADFTPGGNTEKYGLRHGKGTYVWANGDKYEGDWKYDKRTGYGKYTYANGKVQEGQWENGVFENGTNTTVANNDSTSQSAKNTTSANHNSTGQKVKMEDALASREIWIKGMGFAEKKQYDLAIQEYDKAIAMYPTMYIYYTYRGIAFLRIAIKNEDEDDLFASLHDFNKAINLKPNDAQTYVERGKLYYVMHENQKALNDFTKAIDLDKNANKYIAAYSSRAMVYQSLNQPDKAAADMQKYKDLGGK